MDHLQQAKHAIERAETTASQHHANLAAQRAIAHALVALVERIDKADARDAAERRYLLEHD